LTANNIAKLIGIKKGNAWRQMTKLAGQGYIWRRKIKGTYHYLYLKPMGERVLKALWIRNMMRIMSGNNSIPMNLKKRTPWEYYDYERRAIEDWLRKF
jgi:predicted transcriptional regulator